MIPAGDHTSRNLLHRRVSSWSEITSPQQPDEVSLSTSDDNEILRPLLPTLEYEEDTEDVLSLRSLNRKYNWRLWLVFLLMVVSGVSNVVLAKLQALPMYNYPTFLNIYANLMYIIMSFCYILPASTFGWFNNSIPRTHLSSMLRKKPFLVMGFLDAISAAMQVLSTIYLPGTLLVLLPQAAVPLSMLTSRLVLRETFTRYQYAGAFVVFIGIFVVLFPVLTHQRAPEYSCQSVRGEDCSICEMEHTETDCLANVKPIDDDVTGKNTTEFYCQWVARGDSLREDDFLVFVWSLVMVASCFPMVVSSVYKQVALQVHLDPILVNAWVAVFQFLFAIPLAIPAALVSSPKVTPLDLPKNWLQAMGCLFAQKNTIESGCHPDQCFEGALWVHLGLLSSAAYTVSMIFVLKYGSAALLYLGLTLMVPLGHLVFSLHSPSSVHLSDVSGLFVLISGLLLYRFGHNSDSSTGAHPVSVGMEGNNDGNNEDNDDSNDDSNNNENDDKACFLEFLREPFMLMGDI